MLTAKSTFPVTQNGQIYLNHCAFGAVPESVLQAQNEATRLVAEDPDRAYAGALPYRHEMWRMLAELVGEQFGAEDQDIAFAINATDGVESVFNAQNFEPGDEVLFSSQVYGAFMIAAERLLTPKGCIIRQFDIPFPNPTNEQCLNNLRDAITDKTKFVMIEHVTSDTGTVLPIKEMVAICRERNVPVLVDGAQGPGNVPVALKDIDADWYVGDLHKWCFVPQSCAFVHAKRERQKRLTSTLLSWMAPAPFPDSFEWPGTVSLIPALCLPAGLDFIDKQGGLAAIQKKNHDLLLGAIETLGKAWGVTAPVPASMLGCFAVMPTPRGLPYASSAEGMDQLSRDLRDRHGIIVKSPLCLDGQPCLRFSAQLYNHSDDYQRLAEAVLPMTPK